MRLLNMVIVLSAPVLLTTGMPGFAETLDEAVASIARAEAGNHEQWPVDLSRMAPPIAPAHNGPAQTALLPTSSLPTAPIPDSAPISPLSPESDPDFIATAERQTAPRGWTMLLIAGIAASVIVARRLQCPLP
jgi:hypothetical protein